jgi:hypothetical protein
MDPTVVSALAGLVGAIIGGSASVLASWVIQRGQVISESRNRAVGQREELYEKFIESAAQCYADALQHDKPEIPLLVALYANIDLMQIHSTDAVIVEAEAVRAEILGTYLDQNLGISELREMMRDGSIGLLRKFSITCRKELQSLEPRSSTR